LAVLVEDEAELGCACIDFGGGTTTVAVFMKGKFVHVDAVAVGGQHITSDIARGLSTRLEDAERLKTMHGSALPGVSDDNDILSVPPIGDDEHDVPNQVPRSSLTPSSAARRRDSRLVRDRLNASGFAPLVAPHGPDRRRQPVDRARRAARRILAGTFASAPLHSVAGMPEWRRGLPSLPLSAPHLSQFAEMERINMRASAGLA
jgi:cell division protein FtsA